MKRMSLLGILFSIIVLVSVSSANGPVSVVIDIKPGSFPNSINVTSAGVIPVAIMTTDDFDATTVDPSSVLFGPDEAYMVHKRAHVEDVDEDGELDLVFHFYISDTGLACGDTEATLIGQTWDGVPIQGTGAVNTFGCL